MRSLPHEFVDGICKWCHNVGMVSSPSISVPGDYSHEICEIRSESLRAKHILQFMGLELVEIGIDDKTNRMYALADPMPHNDPGHVQRMRVHKFTLDTLEPFLPRPSASGKDPSGVDDKIARLQKAIKIKINQMRDEIPDAVLLCMFPSSMQGRIKEGDLRYWITKASPFRLWKRKQKCLGLVPMMVGIKIDQHTPLYFETQWKLAWYKPKVYKKGAAVQDQRVPFVEECDLQDQLEAFELLPDLLENIHNTSKAILERLDQAVFNH